MATMSEKEIQASSWRETMSSTSDEIRKDTAAVNEKEVEADAEAQSVHWKPGYKDQFPWLGFASLMFIIVCIILEVIVVWSSNTKSQEEWPARVHWSWVKDSWKSYTQLSPNVALAALNTAGNIALAIAIGKGVAISWWRRAMHGASVNHLHNSWSFSTSVLDLITAGKRFNLIALAALTAKIAIIDNVLLQKAAVNAPGYYYQSDINNIAIPVVADIPPNWFGDADTETDLWSPSFFFANDLYQWQVDADFRDFNEQPNIYTWNKTNCFGDCYMNIPAFGFEVVCNETLTQPRADVTPISANYTALQQRLLNGSDQGVPGSPLDGLVQSSVFRLRHGTPTYWNNGQNRTFDQDVILIFTQWANLTSTDENDPNSATCTASVSMRQCALLPAQVSYPVDLTDTRDVPDWASSDAKKNNVPVNRNGLSLWGNANNPYDPKSWGQDFSTGQLTNFNVTGKLYSPWDDKYQSNIGVMASAFSAQFSSYVALEYSNTSGYITRPIAIGAMNAYWTDFTTGLSRTNSSACAMLPQDPMIYIISQINSIAFRSSVSAAFTGDYHTTPLTSNYAIEPPAANVKKFLADPMQSPSVIYIADWAFIGAAAGVMFLCICFILPSYWGYWELGRKVTLGPMEIASAFQAPVLQHGEQGAPGGGEVNKLLEVVGKRQVLYGQTEDGKLAMAGPSDVNRLPKVGPTLKIAGHTL